MTGTSPHFINSSLGKNCLGCPFCHPQPPGTPHTCQKASEPAPECCLCLTHVHQEAGCEASGSHSLLLNPRWKLQKVEDQQGIDCNVDCARLHGLLSYFFFLNRMRILFKFLAVGLIKGLHLLNYQDRNRVQNYGWQISLLECPRHRRSKELIGHIRLHL